MSPSHPVFLLLLGLALSGCYVRSAVDPFSYAPKSPWNYWKPDHRALGMAHPASEEPEECLGTEPLSLAEVMDVALKNNPDTKISWAQAKEAAVQFGQSASSFYPTIQGAFQYARSRSSFLVSQVEAGTSGLTNGLITSTQSVWGPSLSLSYTLFDFGQRRASSESARFALYFADFTHNRNLQTLIQTVTVDFYDLLYQKKLLEALQADLLATKEVLDAAILGNETGARDLSDLLQARTQLLQTEINLLAQEQAVKDSYTTLLDDMGLNATREIHVVDFPISIKLDNSLLPVEDYLTLAAECRPDLLALEAQIESKNQSYLLAARNRMPSLDYSLDFGKSYYSGGFNNDYDYTSTISLTMPLFQGFYLKNAEKLAKTQKEEAEEQYRQLELSMIKEVSDAHFSIGIAYSTVKSASAYLQAAREQFIISMERYKNGVGTILDVTTAQSNLASARASEANAFQKWYVSLATLSYATGTIAINVRCEE